MALWKIAGVQMDCQLGNVAGNLESIRRRLAEAASGRAHLTIFPECALTGYAFDSRDEARPFAQTIPGPATDALAAACRELGIWAVLGMLETAGDRLFNAPVLIGPAGLQGSYAKMHR